MMRDVGCDFFKSSFPLNWKCTNRFFGVCALSLFDTTMCVVIGLCRFAGRLSPAHVGSASNHFWVHVLVIAIPLLFLGFPGPTPP